MEVFPDYTMQRITARMMDIIAAIEDDEHRAWTAEMFVEAGFHGFILPDGSTQIEVRAMTTDGSVLLARLDGATVGYVVGPYGEARYLA